jgi:hypothetical protein
MHDAGCASGASLYAIECPNFLGRGSVCVCVYVYVCEHYCQQVAQVALTCKQPIAQVWGRGSVKIM